MTNPSDHAVIVAMHEYGGGFVRALAAAAIRADADNLARIKMAWPELWEKYRQVSTMKPITKAELTEETMHRR